jgi:hypothetical protein
VLRQTLATKELLDTLQNLPGRDTIGAQTSAVIARDCGLRVAADTSAQGIRAYLYFAMVAQRDSLVAALISQRLRRAKTPVQVDSVVHDAVALYLAAQPARLGAAESLVAQLKTRGPAYRLARMAGHKQLMDYYDLAGERDRGNNDAEQIVVLGRTLTANDESRGRPFVRAAIRHLVEAKSRSEPGSIPALVQLARHEWSSPYWRPQKNDGMADWIDTTMSDSAVCMRITGTRDCNVLAKDAGTPFPYLQGDYVFPLHPGETGQPTPGGVTMVVRLVTRGNTRLGWPTQEAEFELAAGMLRRLMARYGPEKLKLTVVAVTSGWTSIDGVVPAQQEAERLRWFIQDYAHLPATVIVQTAQRHDQWRPAPDGRRIRIDTTQIEKLLPPDAFSFSGEGLYSGELALVGPHGAVLKTRALEHDQTNCRSFPRPTDGGVCAARAQEDQVRAYLDQLLGTAGTASRAAGQNSMVSPNE